MIIETTEAAPLGRSRRHHRGADPRFATGGREPAKTVRTVLRVVAGLAVFVALMAVGTAAIGAAPTKQHRSVVRLTDANGGSSLSAESMSLSTAQAQKLSGGASPTPVPEQVDLFGDSLGYQAEPYLDMFFTETRDFTLTSDTYGGTATCDWLSRMADSAAERPQIAILVFSGNAFTPCMDGVALRSPQYFDLYTRYTEQAIGIFRSVGAHVYLVGTPIDEASHAGWDHLDDIYRQLAQANPLAVTYVDAGAAVETNAGGFTWTLPCMSIEPSCGPSGTNVVRSPDGIHFCPDGTPAALGVTGPCDEYSPGAFRFAFSVVSAVRRYAVSAQGK